MDCYFCRQRDMCISRLQKAKKDYFTSLKGKHITKKKYFWKTIKSLLSNELQLFERIKLLKKMIL